MKKSLAMKLASHRFTVVAPAQINDPDVEAFKVKEKQAKQRAERRAAIEAKTETVQRDGLVVKYNQETNKSPLAKALVKALK